MPKVRAFLDFLVDRFSHAPWREPLPLNPLANKGASTDIPRSQ